MLFRLTLLLLHVKLTFSHVYGQVSLRSSLQHLCFQMYLAIQFYSPKDAESLPPIADVDAISPNSLVNNRSSFLLFAREHHYEFSTLRRAKFSTQAMLYELDRLNSVGIVCESCGVSVGNTNGLLFCSECDVRLRKFMNLCSSSFCH